MHRNRNGGIYKKIEVYNDKKIFNMQLEDFGIHFKKTKTVMLFLTNNYGSTC
jgi:hypothetical protein